MPQSRELRLLLQHLFAHTANHSGHQTGFRTGSRFSGELHGIMILHQRLRLRTQRVSQQIQRILRIHFAVTVEIG